MRTSADEADITQSAEMTRRAERVIPCEAIVVV